MLRSVNHPIVSDLVKSSLEHIDWVLEAKLRNRRDLVKAVLELLNFLSAFLVIDFRVNPALGLVLDVFSHEELILFGKEVRTLALSLVVDPIAFEVISVSLGEGTISGPLSETPLTHVDVSITVDHSAFASWLVLTPVAVISVLVFVEHGASTLLHIAQPVSGVPSSEILLLVSDPECALPVSGVLMPAAFVLVSVLVDLDAEAMLHVVLPGAGVLVTGPPFLTFPLVAAIFILFLGFHPVNGVMGAVFVGLLVI